MTFCRSGAQKNNVYKRDAFVTSWRFHNRAWQPQRHDRLSETSGTLWIHRGALTNQRCSLATGWRINWLILRSMNELFRHVSRVWSIFRRNGQTLEKLHYFPNFTLVWYRCCVYRNDDHRCAKNNVWYHSFVEKGFDSSLELHLFYNYVSMWPLSSEQMLLLWPYTFAIIHKLWLDLKKTFPACTCIYVYLPTSLAVTLLS